MKLTLFILNKDKSASIKRIRVKTNTVKVSGNEYEINSDYIFLRQDFFGIKRYMIIYNGKPFTVTYDIKEIENNDAYQTLLRSNIISKFLENDKPDLMLMLMAVVIGALVGGIVGYFSHDVKTAVSTTNTTLHATYSFLRGAQL